MVIGQLPATFVLAAEESLPLATEEPLIEDFKDSLQPLTVNDGQEEASASIMGKFTSDPMDTHIPITYANIVKLVKVIFKYK